MKVALLQPGDGRRYSAPVTVAALAGAAAIGLATALLPVAGAVLAAGLLVAGVMVPLAVFACARPGPGTGDLAARALDLDAGAAELAAFGATAAALERVHGSGLSGGQRLRLLLPRALLADPPILVLDEPTEGLDPDTAAAVLTDLFDATRGRTTLLVTHDPAVVAADVVELAGGRLSGPGHTRPRRST